MPNLVNLTCRLLFGKADGKFSECLTWSPNYHSQIQNIFYEYLDNICCHEKTSNALRTSHKKYLTHFSFCVTVRVKLYHNKKKPRDAQNRQWKARYKTSNIKSVTTQRKIAFVKRRATDSCLTKTPTAEPLFRFSMFFLRSFNRN